MSDEDNKVLGATMSDEELELDNELEDTDDVEALKEALKKEKTAKQQILARAKKAEAQLKEKKPAESFTNNNTPTHEDVETKILKAQGVSDDEIEYLKKLSKLNNTSIIEAQSDDIFKAFKSKKEAEEKAEKAKLGASRGSGSQKRDKNFNSKGLSDDEHKELWRQNQGR